MSSILRMRRKPISHLLQNPWNPWMGLQKKDQNVALAGGPSGKPQGKGVLASPVLVICGSKGNQISRATCVPGLSSLCVRVV